MEYILEAQVGNLKIAIFLAQLKIINRAKHFIVQFGLLDIGFVHVASYLSVYAHYSQVWFNKLFFLPFHPIWAEV